MNQLVLDLRSAVRQVRLRPGQALLSMVLLGIGIAAVTGAFALLRGVIFQPLPFPDPGRLVHLERNHVERGEYAAAVPLTDFRAWAEAQSLLEGLAGYGLGTINLSDAQGPRRLYGCFVTADIFTVLGVEPLHGSTFRPEHEGAGADPVLVLSHALWQERYGGDESVVGRTVTANGMPATVIGVMPPGFCFPFREEAWMPHRVDQETLAPGEGMHFEVVARMKPQVDLGEVEAELGVVAAALAARYPDSHAGMSLVDAKPFAREYLGPEARALLFLLLVLGFLVLVMGSANVANLTLARVARRRREMAIRAALGATPERLERQMLVETLVGSAGGLFFGIGLSFVLLRLMEAYLWSTNQPFWIRVEVDLWATLWAVLMMLAAGLLAGLYPARQASRIELNELLKDGGRSTSLHLSSFARLLVGAQIAMSGAVLLLVLLMVRAEWQTDRFPWPFATEDVLTARMGLFEADYPGAPERRAFMSRLLVAVEEDPAVASAALGTRYRFGSSFLVDWERGSELEPSAAGSANRQARLEMISPGYFRALGLRPLVGREFTAADTPDAPRVALVNTVFVEKFLPGKDPVGMELLVEGVGDDGGDEWRTIVGVVPDLRMAFLEEDEEEQGEGLYIPITDDPPRFFTLLAKAAGGEAASLAPVLHARTAAVDPDLPLYHVESVSYSLKEANKLMRLFLWIFLGFGGAVAFLAAGGIFGVVSFSVNQRTAEIGIRMALGASRRKILQWVYLGAWKPWMVGLVVGLGLGELLVWNAWTEIYGSTDATLQDHLIVAVLISLIVVAAVFRPARRAACTSPQKALREE